jgi:hypothetical protein
MVARLTALGFVALLLLGPTPPAHAISVTPFGPAGEGGDFNGQLFTIGSGGQVFELDAFVNIQGLDLNGATAGTSAQLSVDALPSGLDYSFSSSLLDSDTDILLTYEFTNNTAGTLSDLVFLSFLDAEIDEPLNTFFNEVATTSGSLASGQLFEVDEPGFVFGDIFSNLRQGSLDGTNITPPEEDVSMALEFSFAAVPLEIGDRATIEIMISEDGDTLGPFAITQSDTDPRSTTAITYSGESSVSGGGPGQVIPEPRSLLLFAPGAMILAAGLRRSPRRRSG